MSRMNNTGRSLRIISKQNGWDPDQIEGGPNLSEIYHERVEPLDSDTWPIPGVAGSPHHRDAGQGGITPRTHETDDRSAPQRTTNADPYPGMPGAD